MREDLSHPNINAFLKATAEAEGGDYDFKYGAVKGKKNDPWRFTDFSTHPGAGKGGHTPAGMYQITKVTWEDHGIRRMGLTDFSPGTQDLIAVSMLHGLKVTDQIKAGDIDAGLAKASIPWAALPQGPGQPGQHDQRHVDYEHFKAMYLAAGGKLK
jgi:muramidase (phage lysozyme)